MYDESFLVIIGWLAAVLIRWAWPTTYDDAVYAGDCMPHARLAPRVAAAHGFGNVSTFWRKHRACRGVKPRGRIADFIHVLPSVVSYPRYAHGCASCIAGEFSPVYYVAN